MLAGAPPMPLRVAVTVLRAAFLTEDEIFKMELRTTAREYMTVDIVVVTTRNPETLA